MTLTAKRENIEVTVTIDDDADMDDLLAGFRTLAYGLGYAHETVEEYFG